MLQILAWKFGNMKIVCSPSRYAKTLGGLSDKHKTAISKNGFGGMLHMKPITLRRIMLVKVAHRYIVDKQMFSLCDAEIPMTPLDVHRIMGLPVDGNDIAVDEKTKISEALFFKYKSQKPGENYITLKALEHGITTSQVPDDDFIRQFVLYTIGVILAPTTKDHVDSKYLAFVEKVSEIPKYNWGQFTLSNLLSCVQNFKIEKNANLQGNLALLQVSATFLLCINFPSALYTIVSVLHTSHCVEQFLS